jgi:hypothetical protein
MLPAMSLDTIIASIDSEIARLEKARALLSASSSPSPNDTRQAKRKLSRAARKRIADAQRKRWAKQRAAK